jgi:hypothetical protein
MAKVTLKFNGPLGIFQRGNVVNSSTQTKLGTEVIKLMKDAMGAGLSPVKGFGRYAGYAVTRTGRKNAYPKNVQKQYPGKTVRPVNLKLTGDLWDAITHQKRKNGVSIGHHTPTVDIHKKFETHNVGVDPLVPQRKYLPDEGEGFIVSIMREIKDIYLRRIKDIIRSK